MRKTVNDPQWSNIIHSTAKWYDFHFRELWDYRNLIGMFVKRNFTTMYKQTILGPLWIIINPLLSSLVFTVVFGKLADIPTQGIPPYIFYMAGNILWILFSGALSKVALTFSSNASIFGKVYFPRLTVPISTVLTSLIQFFVQFSIFSAFLLYMITQHADIHPNVFMLLFPLLLLEIGMLVIGVGTLISALTAKYRDLNALIGFGLQLWMYASPVVYPASVVPGDYLWLYMLNPMAPILETFRYGFLGTGCFSWAALGMSWAVTLGILFVGLLFFYRVERCFLDTV